MVRQFKEYHDYRFRRYRKLSCTLENVFTSRLQFDGSFLLGFPFLNGRLADAPFSRHVLISVIGHVEYQLVFLCHELEVIRSCHAHFSAMWGINTVEMLLAMRSGR